MLRVLVCGPIPQQTEAGVKYLGRERTALEAHQLCTLVITTELLIKIWSFE